MSAEEAAAGAAEVAAAVAPAASAVTPTLTDKAVVQVHVAS